MLASCKFRAEACAQAAVAAFARLLRGATGTAFARLLRGAARLWLVALAVGLLAPVVHSPAAHAETRTLKLYYTHTREKAEVTFKRNGRYLPEGLRKANHMLRDWRRNEPTKMDPKVLDLLWEVYKEAGARDYIHIVSGYRSPATNSMLRRTRGGQAEKSQHMVGKAIDFFIPGVKLSKLRAIALRKQAGGVGYYPKSGSPFVHIDTGRVRHWPRMSRQELVAVFPNGKTLHVPSDGKPLPGYQQALAAYKANGRGDTSGPVRFEDDEKPAGGGSGKTLLAMLFGGGADESEDEADTSQVAARAPEPAPEPAAKPRRTAEPAPVDVAAVQPQPLEIEPSATPSARPVPPGEVALAPAAPEPVPAPEPVAEFAALPNRNAPVPTPAPRAVPAEEAPVAVAAAPEPQGLGESEIAALLAADVAPANTPVPSPAPDASALAPVVPADTGNPFDALLPAEGLAPQPRPDVPSGTAGEAVAAIDAATQENAVIAALAPVPQPRPTDAPAPRPQPAGVQADAAPAVPAPKAERVQRVQPAVAALAPATQGKSGRVLPRASAATSAAAPAVAPLPVDSSRFGPRTGGSGAATPVDQTRTAAIPAAPAQAPAKAPAAASAAPGAVMPDGSTLIKSGTIPLGD